MIRRSYRIRGRVQGVGFRDFVARLGRSLELAGGARNENDGSVAVTVAARDEAELDELRAGLERGPGPAVVESVEEIPLDEGRFDVRFGSRGE